jgi:hypothetical protein
MRASPFDLPHYLEDMQKASVFRLLASIQMLTPFLNNPTDLMKKTGIERKV